MSRVNSLSPGEIKEKAFRTTANNEIENKIQRCI